jgi:hypothetical protein
VTERHSADGPALANRTKNHPINAHKFKFPHNHNQTGDGDEQNRMAASEATSALGADSSEQKPERKMLFDDDEEDEQDSGPGLAQHQTMGRLEAAAEPEECAEQTTTTNNDEQQDDSNELEQAEAEAEDEERRQQQHQQLRARVKVEPEPNGRQTSSERSDEQLRSLRSRTRRGQETEQPGADLDGVSWIRIEFELSSILVGSSRVESK